MGDRESASDGVIAMLSVTLDRSSAEPLVRQLYLRIRELILAGRLHAGARLPSTRKLARDLEVSRTVVLDAFGHLTAEGFLEAAIGAGHFVASLPLDEPSAAAAADPIAGKDDTGSIWQVHGEPFDPAWQGVDIFPSQLWGRMLGRGWRRHHSDGLERHWAGLPALRTAISDHLHALRGLKFGSAFGAVEYRAIDHQSTLGAYVGRLDVKDGKGMMVGWTYRDGAKYLPSDDVVKTLRPASA